MLDKPKLISWLRNYQCHVWNDEENDLNEGKGVVLEALIQEIESSTFDPTPVQPDTPKPGDKVKHRKMKHLGIGNVLEIAKSGERAYVDWPNYDKSKVNWAPTPAYYRLDKLEVIPNGD
ncbi:hypothetical protein [Paenibacillus donghaensis]|uniref:Uncharacterized protein n=1 Tax=Paenibacillus donghaensis TaxID=414771 RepID=A0A2Z2KD30_9BACL|nr:hypothetical protein [Paenibacillus donghaensis]ASA20930.1 hypothetical protein B9T62_09120 [Paenibacillus donghaensis]